MKNTDAAVIHWLERALKPIKQGIMCFARTKKFVTVSVWFATEQITRQSTISYLKTWKVAHLLQTLEQSFQEESGKNNYRAACCPTSINHIARSQIEDSGLPIH